MLCQEQESESKVCEKRATATRPNDNRTVSEQQTTQDAETITRRIILLGKTGAGKSSLANTIFGENVFEVYHGTTGTKTCVSKTKNINGRQVKLMDTPGLFDSDPGNIDLSPEILKSIIEFAPVTHAFLLVLKVERFTKHELAVVDEMLKCFSEEALKYTTVVFTHGDNLPKGKKIEEWVSHYEALRNLVQKCGGRCHVFDNRYWKNNSQDQYRNNQNQVQELLNTIDKTVRDNRGPYCTDNLLQIMLSLLERERESRASSSCCML